MCTSSEAVQKDKCEHPPLKDRWFEMAVYAVLSKLTDEGRKTLKAKPERVKEVNEEMAKMGAKVLHQYALLGEYDFLTVLEAADNAAISRVMVELGSRGTLETNTLSAIPVDEFLAGFKG
jgi:uncharacterized protein with GYD domain